MAGKGVQLGFLKYVLGFDSLQFKKGISQADADLAKLQKSFAAKGREFQALGKSLTAFVTLPLAGIAAAGIKEAQETASAMAQVKASLASMGPVAGRTAAQLKATSDALEAKSLYEGDQILKEVTATMLTFGNVTGTTFDRAQQAAVDLATKFGTDLGSAAVMVGKALNDPVKGLTALQRVGVSFTESQREQVKAMVAAGNAAGAQQVILAALEQQVRGSAAAAQDADPWNKLSDAFKSISESIGTLLLPIIPPLANALASVANWVTSLDPTTQKWVVGIAAAAAALGPLLIVVGNFVTVISKVGVLAKFTAGLLGLAAAEGTAATGATAAGIAIRGMLGPIGLAITAATGLYLAFKHWDQIKPIVQSMVTQVANNLRGNFRKTIDETKAQVHSLAEKFRWLKDVVVTHSYVPDMVDEIGATMRRLDGEMVKPATDAANKTAGVFEKLRDQLAPLLDRLYPEQAAGNQLAADLRTLDAAQKAGVLSASAWLDAIDRLTGATQVSPELMKSIVPVDQATNDLQRFVEANDNAVGRARTVWDQWAASIPQTAAQIGEAFGGIALRGVDDLSSAITDVITGARSLKDAFADVAKSIIADLIRMSIRMLIFRALSSAFPKLFGGGVDPGGASSFGGFRANGGPVVPGKSYVVGERGPEFVSFGRKGYVTPANDAGGGGITINQTIAPNFAGNAATREDLVRMAAMTKQATLQAVAEKRRRSARG